MGQESQQSPMFSPKFKAKAPHGSGIWSPNQQETTTAHVTTDINQNQLVQSTNVDKIDSSSATTDRPEFRPVKFDSPVLPRRYVRNESNEAVQPPWTYSDFRPSCKASSCTNLSQGQGFNNIGSNQYCSATSIANKIRSFEQIDKSSSHSNINRIGWSKKESKQLVKPNEIIYSLKNEYYSEPETDSDHPKKMAQLGRRKFDGIGPTTKEGMPIVLRSEVKEPRQHEWYKKIFQTLHKTKDDDDYVTVRYKSPRGRYPYKEKSNGYMSEPERVYDSDYYSTMYSIDRRRTPIAPRTTSIGPDEKDYGTVPNPVRSGIGGYKMQPGKIEDYAPGHSSLSVKEKMAQRETQKLSHHYTEGNLSRALKEQGYESDSNLIFRKKEESHYAEINPSEQRQSYKNVQSGGEPPLLGFRKPAPEKLKESDEAPPRPPQLSQVIYDANGFDYQESPSRYIESDVNIHYKTPIRYEPKEIIAEEELARRQAEAMRKLYEEERRQKYLKELQDINSRRHTDNFTASQKSPIALNRYDDFVCDLAPKSPNFTKTIARALFNFQGQTARELTFKKGDLITIRRQIDDNWYEGEYNAMLGLFPVSYVEVISRDYIKRLPKRPSEGQARAKFNFQAQSGIELSLNKGELVTLTRRVDKNWFEGKIANRKGIFPVTYVEVLTDIGAEDLSSTVTTTTTHTKAIVPTKQPSLETLRTSINNELNSLTNRNPSGILRETKTIQKTKVLHVDTDSEPLTYRALYKYRPQNNDELELLEGDLIYVIEKCDDGWYVGSSQRTGCFGTFPGNYVELI